MRGRACVWSGGKPNPKKTKAVVGSAEGDGVCGVVVVGGELCVCVLISVGCGGVCFARALLSLLFFC